MSRLDNLAATAPQTMPSTVGTTAIPPSTTINTQGNGPAEKSETRYLDAYRHAGFVVGVGKTIKTIGAIIGILIALVGLIGAAELSSGPFGSQSQGGIFFGFTTMVAAATIWFLFFIAGVIVAAQGQQLLASLDSAVCSSPFMDMAAKAKAMSLI
jgi:hypothetical protein